MSLRSSLCVVLFTSGMGTCGCVVESSGPAREPLPKTRPIVEAFVKRQEIQCSWGLAEPCKFTGHAYKYGMGVPIDAKRALGYFRRACSLESVEGCVMVGVMTVELGDRARYAEALVIWEKACESGSYAGCHAAGATLALDQQKMGIPRDMSRGRAYLDRACAARYLPSCVLGAALTVELKETSRYATAHSQLAEACKLQQGESCHYLGQSELDETFGPRDELAAAKYFWEGCYNNSGASCFALAWAHAKGIGTSANADKARKLAAMACALGHQPACELRNHPDRDFPPP